MVPFCNLFEGPSVSDDPTLDPAHDGTLLGRFNGGKPPAAPWFEAAVAHAPERSTFPVEDAEIELLTWGEVGQPGLLFLHGNAAHADWWSPIAPQFASDYRCAAISWSGMGRSQWRKGYTIPTFVREALGAIEVAGLAASGTPPVIVAHSFGGFPTLGLASARPEAISGAILVDSAPPKGGDGPPRGLAEGRTHHPRYPSLEAALRRFRFMPEQRLGCPEIIDLIARGALHEVPETEDAPGGWTWRFDPQFWSKFDRGNGDLGAVPQVPCGIIVGGKSALFPEGRLAELQDMIPDLRFTTVIDGAHHHVLVDHPLELVAAIREGLPQLG
jgi:pimeloyl-ACP methyl ester carboxylesterase